MARRGVQVGAAHPAGPDAVSSYAWEALLLAAVLPLAVLVLLYRLDVPLGRPDRFVYLYSPVVGWRLQSVPVALVLAAVLGGGVWLTAAGHLWRRRAGLVLIATAATGLAGWAYLAPPEHLNQHVFNMHSPSQDGAFVLEAFQVDSVRAYLRSFPQRAHTTPEEMRGTRVISNPPGATLLAVAARRLVVSYPALGAYLRGRFELDDPELADVVESAAVGLLFCWLLTAVWLVSGLALYGLGRLFFSPVAAATFSLCGLLTPMTLLFAPGKDPAQLLTVAVPAWLWFLGVRRGWWWPAAIAGFVFVLSCVVSLVHVWVAAIVVGASVLSAWHAPGGLLRVLVRHVVPAGAGALLAAGVLYVLCDFNVVAATWAVVRSQAEVTRGPEAMPLVWQLLGIPLFLLFAGPALWVCWLWRRRQPDSSGHAAGDDARLGGYLIVVTVVVMLVTAGFTNVETLRLWIPFVPLLLLGGALRLAVFRRPAVHLLVALVAVQVASSALHWSLMDVREAETRLSTEQFFWRHPTTQPQP